ncbi:MAG TPA: glycosyltransferase [Candidatus Omnitrophota bacterium]|nr:glycosyltransferase [Candidatus Omnitrophota bacterium]
MPKILSKNRVMHITYSLGTGGMEKLVREIVERTDPSMFESSVCCLWIKGRFSEDLEKRGIKVCCMDKRDGFDHSLFSRMADIFKKEKISIVHSHDSSANLYASVSARLAGVKKVFNTEHGGIYFETERKKKINRLLCLLNKKVICVSDSIKNDLMGMGLPEIKLKVIPNGLDFSEFDIELDRNRKRRDLGLCESDFVISSIGRLSKVKNHEMLLASVKPILQRMSNAKIIIAGDGPLRQVLEERAKEYTSSGRVLFLGTRKDVPEILKISDCFVACSESESFGLSVLEAMAAGVPVVSTCAGGLKEIVKDGVTGILISKNDAGALVDGIYRIYSDKLYAQGNASRAKEMVKISYGVDQMVKRYQELYLS